MPSARREMPDASSGGLSEKFYEFAESREAGTSGCARSRPARWQRGGHRKQRRKRSFLTTTPPPAHAGRSPDVSRWKVGRNAPRAKICGDTLSATESSNHLGKFLKFVQKRTLPLVEHVNVDGAQVTYSNVCSVQGVQHHHGTQFLAAVMDLLAVHQPLCVQQTAEVPLISEGVAATHTRAHPTNNASTNVGRNCSTLHPSQSSPCGSVHPHHPGDVHSPVRASGVENEGSCPTACATAPMSVGRDRNIRNCSVFQERGRDGLVLVHQRWFQ